MRGHLTEKADVFAFGVVALEIVSGRPNSDSSLEEEKVYLLEWVGMNNIFVPHVYIVISLLMRWIFQSTSKGSSSIYRSVAMGSRLMIVMTIHTYTY
jgi:hypothetical protein